MIQEHVFKSSVQQKMLPVTDALKDTTWCCVMGSSNSDQNKKSQNQKYSDTELICGYVFFTEEYALLLKQNPESTGDKMFYLVR